MPGFVCTAIAGLLTAWIDRKVSAKMQWRAGPPWFQPWADLCKLLGKETIIPDGGSKIAFWGAPVIAVGAVTLVSTMLWLLNSNPQTGFRGDLIVVICLLNLPAVALMVGDAAARNPLVVLGLGRERKLMLAYELPFILAILICAIKTGSIMIGQIVSYQAAQGMVTGSLSGVIALAVTLLVVQAKLGYLPFDIAEAEQELMGGPILEYSGLPLAMLKLTKAMLGFTLPVLMITLFLGGIELSITGFAWFVFKYLVIVVLLVLIKNTNPRIRIDQAVRFFWGPVMTFAILGFVLALLGL